MEQTCIVLENEQVAGRLVYQIYTLNTFSPAPLHYTFGDGTVLFTTDVPGKIAYLTEVWSGRRKPAGSVSGRITTIENTQQSRLLLHNLHQMIANGTIEKPGAFAALLLG